MKIVKLFSAVLLALGLMTAVSVNAETSLTAKMPKVAAKEVAKVTSKVNINSADAKALAGLKGIGPKRAQAIVAYREKNGNFKSVGEWQSDPRC